MRVLRRNIFDKDGEFEVGVYLVRSQEVSVERQSSTVPHIALAIVEVEVLDCLSNASCIILVDLDKPDHKW